MTTVTEHHQVSPQPDALATTVVTSWKAPIAFAVFTLAALALAVFAPREGDTTYRLNASDKDAIIIANLSVPAMPALWVVVVLLLLATAFSVWLVTQKRRVPLWLIVVFAIDTTAIALVIRLLSGVRPPAPALGGGALLGSQARAVHGREHRRAAVIEGDRRLAEAGIGRVDGPSRLGGRFRGRTGHEHQGNARARAAPEPEAAERPAAVAASSLQPRLIWGVYGPLRT